MKNIEDLRVNIDKVDDEIIKLLNERMEYVKKIGELKNASGGHIYRPEREKAIISRLESIASKNLDRKAIEAIYFEIFSICKKENTCVFSFLQIFQNI